MEDRIENIARTIFGKSPEGPDRYRLLSDEEDLSIAFEILITFFMEGVMIKYPGLGEVDLATLNGETLTSQLLTLGPWVESVGYTLTVEVCTEGETAGRYCRILILDGPEGGYTFLLNPDFPGSARYRLIDHFAVFSTGNSTIRIGFAPHF